MPASLLALLETHMERYICLPPHFYHFGCHLSNPAEATCVVTSAIALYPVTQPWNYQVQEANDLGGGSDYKRGSLESLAD